MKNYFLIFLFVSFSAYAQWSEVGGAPLNNLSLFDTLPHAQALTIHCDNVGNIYTSVFAENPNEFGGVFFVLIWNGTAWQNLGERRTNSIIRSVTGVLYSLNINSVAQWGGGTNWYEVGGQNALGANLTHHMCVDSTENLYVSLGTSVAKWSGSQWTYLPSLTSQTTTETGISGLCSDGNGNIYAAGNFTNANGVCYVAKWDGTTWSELGTDTSLAQMSDKQIYFLTADNNGNIYAAGALSTTDNKIYVAKWNGTTWQKLIGSNGLPNGVYADGSGASPAISVDKYGNVYVVCAGSSIYKWNGNDWINMTANDFHFYYNPAYQPTIRITGICMDTSGNLYASLSSFSDNNFKAQAYVLKYSNAHLVGINEIRNESLEMKIYPNPVNEMLNVEFKMRNENVTVQLYDITGKIVLHKTINANKQSSEIDVSSLAKGLYIAELRAEGKQAKRVKVVKE